MKKMNPVKMLIERREGGWGVDDQSIIDAMQTALKRSFIPSCFSKQKGNNGKGWLNIKDAVGAAESHHQMLFPLDHAVPSVYGNIDDFQIPPSPLC